LTLSSFGPLLPGRVLAVPAFAVQTSQPCAACHVGAFGPQLKPYGRDFKLHGYVASDGVNHGLPLAVTTQFSFTHTAAPQPGGAAPGFAANDNFAFDQGSLYYAGRITPSLGAFAQLTYDGVAKTAQIDNTDIRHTGEGQLLGQDLVWGITINNNPTAQDVWNSTPVWGFPYNSSKLAPAPVASALIDGQLGQRVGGAGYYMLWNDLIYMEAAAYTGLSTDILKATGISPKEGLTLASTAPYGRLALVKDWQRHHLEVGAYGISANVIPAGLVRNGLADRMTDLALDATYQFIVNPAAVASDMVSAHATIIGERGSMQASRALTGALPSHSLNTMRADISYSVAATITASVQIFRVSGTTDNAYWGTPNGSPKSGGAIFEIAFVPWGKPDSPNPRLNTRLALQYVNYFQFNGSRVNAGRNNAFYASLWTGLAF
jgi:hypothetical protein